MQRLIERLNVVIGIPQKIRYGCKLCNPSMSRFGIDPSVQFDYGPRTHGGGKNLMDGLALTDASFDATGRKPE